MTTTPLRTLTDRVPSYAGSTLWAVQWMRAAAALMVVLGHSQSAVSQIARHNGGHFTRLALPWGAGVDLFFVISGFIMVHASHSLIGKPGASLVFVKRRLIRILPLYWMVTSVFLALLAAASLKGGDFFPSATAILASYAFIPFDTHNIGQTFPVLDLGWTLNYEMLFYGIFAVAIARARRGGMALALMLLLAAVALGIVIPRHLTIPYVWTRPILLNFAMGMAVALVAAKGVVLPVPLRLAMVAGGVVLLALDPMQVFAVPPGVTVSNGWPRVICAGLPASVVLAGAVLGPIGRPLFPVFTRLGDMSYSLYLLHPFALILMEKLVQKSPAARGLPVLVLLAGVLALAIALAAVSYRYFERPVTRRLSQWAFGPPRAAPRPPISSERTSS